MDGESCYHHLLAIPSPDKLRSVLKHLLDEEEFLSPYGIRALSRYHKDNPFEVNVQGELHRVEYVSGESNTFMFGGNSNWRGPIWLCGMSHSSSYYFGTFDDQICLFKNQTCGFLQ